MGSPGAPPLKKPGTSLAERGSRFVALQLRICSVLQLLAGGGYIALAVVLQFPPGDPLTLGLWAIGCLTILAAVCGCFGGCRVRCCLGIYVVLAVLALAAQLGLVLYLFIAPGHAEEQLSNYQRTQQGQIKENLHEIIIMGRWVLLGLLGAQLLAIALASCLRCCTRHRSYQEFQEEEQAEYEARRGAASDQLEQLRAKLGLAEGAPPPGPADPKRVIHLHAAAGSAAERQQQQAMRSSLFQRSDGGGGASGAGDLEAGRMIGSRVSSDVASAPSQPWDTAPLQPSPTSAWPQAATPAAQRSFKPSWSKAGKP